VRYGVSLCALADVRKQRWNNWEIVTAMLCSNCEPMLTGVSDTQTRF
jgi:hypothetical protein